MDLTHLGAAIRVLDEAEALAIDDALTGLSEAVEGRSSTRSLPI